MADDPKTEGFVRGYKPVAKESFRLGRLEVEGFKSFEKRTTIELAPLTVLAGANSSGKSSAFQPLLLLKQTLEVQFDPGPLYLNGPHVKFTALDQMLWRGVGTSELEGFRVGLSFAGDHGFEISSVFSSNSKGLAELSKTIWASETGCITSSEKGNEGDLEDFLGKRHPWYRAFLASDVYARDETSRDRCFWIPVGWPLQPERFFPVVLHVPGLRDNPSRSYPVTATGETFPGTFEPYTAALLQAWQENKDGRLQQVADDLRALGLTWRVQARRLDSNSVEVLVGRLPRAQKKGPRDLVNVADVGIGVSQVLPVLVALHAAPPDSLVLIEQPELHLHPKAQEALAPILAAAAKRGVQVVVETHSPILLLALQTLVAEGGLEPDKTRLHWFTRDERGATSISTTQLNEWGAYGDWPEDFYEVRSRLESRYLEAAEKRMAAEQGGEAGDEGQ